MITEDYISFETAKLLKEKGFDEPTVFRYGDYPDNNDLLFAPSGMAIVKNSETQPYFYSAPTFQMTRKWLREKHHLHIEIRITNHSISNMVNVIKYYWVMANTETGKWCDESTVYTVKAFDKSEDAEEDAIRYALEKLT